MLPIVVLCSAVGHSGEQLTAALGIATARMALTCGVMRDDGGAGIAGLRVLMLLCT